MNVEEMVEDGRKTSSIYGLNPRPIPGQPKGNKPRPNQGRGKMRQFMQKMKSAEAQSKCFKVGE